MLRVNEEIPRSTLTHLFWNRFPYRVDVTPRLEKKPKLRKALVRALYQEFRANYRLLVKGLKKARPKGDDVCRVNNQGFTAIHYFLTEEVAQSFIDNLDMKLFEISSVIAPPEATPLEKFHSTDAYRHRVRDSLFHGKYTWRVKFKRAVKWESDKTAAWVQDFFDNDVERCKVLRTEKTFVLYLRDEDDVLVVKLAQSGNIHNVEKVVINNNNKDEGSTPNESIPVSQVG